ncbi:MAG: septum formation protein Maf [Planctomycetes bacterium]|nr:septum formation protein Maf [Planctomycetota bacterium]
MPMPEIEIILASSSPRRRGLLTENGYRFRVVEPDPSAEDNPRPHEAAAEMVARLALQKGTDVARRVERGIVVACDTAVECGGQILNKPDDVRHAEQMLRWLSGREHYVYSGLCVWARPAGKPIVRVDKTTLKMATLTDDTIREYLASGLWEGKAGAFGFQDRQGWLTIIAGSESNVVGLPLELLDLMLDEIVRQRPMSPAAT